MTERHSGTRYGPASRRKAVHLYKTSEISLAELARMPGMPTEKILHGWLRQAGVAVRQSMAPVYPRAEIFAKLKDGYTRNEIAEEYGCSLKYLSTLANGQLNMKPKTRKYSSQTIPKKRKAKKRQPPKRQPKKHK